MLPSPSYWEAQSPVPHRPSLSNRGKLQYVDIAIVGAGFCGSWLAYFLLEQNPKLKVTIFERDRRNLGASLRNAGFLSCGNVSEWLEDTKAFSWDEVLRTLDARISGVEIIKRVFGKKIQTYQCGSADFDPLTEEKREMMTRLNGALTGLGREPFFQLRDLEFGGKRCSVPFNSFDAEVNPLELLECLHTELQAKGVDFQWQAEVVELGNGKLHYQLGERAESTTYGHAFLCTNAFARQLVPESIVQPARGQILVTSPCVPLATRCLGFLRSGYDYFRFVDSRILVGGGRLEFKKTEDTDSFETTNEIAAYLKALAARVIGHQEFRVDYHWAGIMGLREGAHASISDLAQVKCLDSKTEELAGFGGWGVTLTPYVARWRAGAFR